MAEKEGKGSKASPTRLREVLPPGTKTGPETAAKGLQDSIMKVQTLPRGGIKLREALEKSKAENTA